MEYTTYFMKDNKQIGYLVHKLILKKNGEEDFILTDMNFGFQNFTGLDMNKAVGTNLSWLNEKLELHTINWLEEISEITSSRHSKPFQRKIELQNREFLLESKLIDSEFLVTSLELIQDDKEEIQTPIPPSLQNKKIEFQEMEIIFNSTQDALFLMEEKNGQIVYVRNNMKHQELTGLSPNYIRGKTSIEVLGDEVGKRQEENCRKCLESEETYSFEETIEFIGSKKVLLTKLSPFILPNGTRYIVGSRVDITQTKKLLEDKVEVITKFKNMFDLHKAVMLLIDPFSGIIVDANPAASEFYGYSLEELKSMYIQEINTLSKNEIEKMRLKALDENQKYFLFPHKLKNGEIKYVDVYSCPITFGDEQLLYSIILDATEREKNREELFREKELLNITFNSIGDGVVTTNNNGVITRINKIASKIIGLNSTEIIGKDFSEIFNLRNENTGEVNNNIIQKVLETGKECELEEHTILVTSNGKNIPVADSAAPIINEEGTVHGAVMVFRDISAEKERKEKILYLSYHDTLTGLFNRHYFLEILEKIDVEQFYPLAVIMGDVNGLKMTNDVFGHEAGDQLLKSVSELMIAGSREQDIIIRWGGDEFVILMPKADKREVEQYLRQVKLAFMEKKIHKFIGMSVSFGYAIKRKKEELMDILLQEAEAKMYQNKLVESKEFRKSVLDSVLKTLHEKSTETRGHIERLKKYSMEIGKALNLTTEILDELSLLADLHDIGEIGVDENLFHKPADLSPEEWAEMRRHAEIGYRITQSIPEVSMVSEMILHHHERWDGKGYPRGLERQNIPINCRIISVVDAYDAMISGRVYRKAYNKKMAIKELQDNAGKQFDPQIVSIFIKNIDSMTAEENIKTTLTGIK